MMRAIVSILILSARICCFADDTRVVDAYYKYHIPENVTRYEAEATAMERAIVEALAQEFGTVVNAETWSDVQNNVDGSQIDVWRLGSSIVKGQWLETISGPDYNYVTDGSSMAVEVRLRGCAEPLSERMIDLQLSPLRVSADGAFESQRFKSGDRLEFKFSAPIDGSLLLFLDDGDGTVCQLLPFATEKTGAFAVKAGMQYHFFHDTADQHAEQYRLLSDKEIERNSLYVIFTPNHIVKPITSENEHIRLLSTKSFRSWLSRQRNLDKDLQIRTISLTIIK